MTTVCGVYEIRNIINNKRYIGGSIRLYKRLRDHRNALRRGDHRNRYLQRAWTKYGEDSFEFAVLELIDDIGLLIEHEQQWLDKCRADTVYNFNSCVNAPWLGKHRTNETRRKISNVLKGRPRSEKTKQLISISHKGKIHTKRHNANVSKSHVGFTGRQHTAETKAKMRKSAKLIWQRRKAAASGGN